MDLRPFIRDIPNFPKEGIIFKDITPLLSTPEAFAHAVDVFAKRAEKLGVDAVAGIESRGFLFGAPVALALKTPFVPIRKVGKLPHKTMKESYDLEYGQGVLEIHEDALQRGDRVMLVDDLLATGGTLAAASRLIEKLGAEIVELVTVVELEFLKGRDCLGGRPFFSMLKY